MSISGALVFYSSLGEDAPIALLRQLFALCGVHGKIMIARSVGEEHSWSEYQDLLAQGGFVVIPDQFEYGFKDALNPQEAEEYFIPGRCTVYICMGCEAADSLCASLRASIPGAIRDEFAPELLTLHLGFHDLIETWPADRFIARPFCALHFEGYGSTPTNANEYLRLLKADQAFRRLESELRRLLPDLRHTLRWSV